MSLRDRFVEIWNDYKYDDTVEGMIDALLTAVCEEEGHRLRQKEGLWICERCGFSFHDWTKVNARLPH